MKKITKKKLAKIVQQNPLVDADLLQKSMRQLQELRALGISKHSYDLVIPYSKKLTASTDN